MSNHFGWLRIALMRGATKNANEDQLSKSPHLTSPQWGEESIDITHKLVCEDTSEIMWS